MKTILAGLTILAADVLTKYSVDRSLVLGESVPVMENIFHITYARNEGAAFSILQGQTLFLIGFSLLALGLLVGFAWRFRMDRLAYLGAVVAISGALGNLYDRLTYGYVRDFLDFRVWPIFNVADMAIVAGMVLLAVRVIWLEREDENGSNRNGGTHGVDR